MWCRDNSTFALIAQLHRDVATAVSFARNGGMGDTWYCNAVDIAYELEARGHDVLDDWTVLLRDMPAPIRTHGFGHWPLPDNMPCPVCDCDMEYIDGKWLCPYDPAPYEEWMNGDA